MIIGKTDTWTLSAFLILFGLIILIAFPFTFVAQSIFDIEKRVWIDSFFDKRELAPAQSWRIAKRTFSQAFRLKLAIFLRYIMPAIVGILACVFFAFFVFAETRNTAVAGVLLFLGCVGIPIALWFYNRIRFRFLWFVFLDRYDAQHFSVGDILKEMNALNEIAKGEAVKKLLSVEFGIDAGVASVEALTSFTFTGLHTAYQNKAISGATAIVGAYVGAVASQVADFGKIVAIYLLYRSARVAQGGSSQVVNESLYDLK